MKKKSFVSLLTSISIGTLCIGCTFTQSGHGEYGFRQSTEWAFYHRANADKKHIKASSNTEFTSLEQWLFESAQEKNSNKKE